MRIEAYRDLEAHAGNEQLAQMERSLIPRIRRLREKIRNEAQEVEDLSAQTGGTYVSLELEDLLSDLNVYEQDLDAIQSILLRKRR